MSPRSIRRAVERKALKDARKVARLTGTVSNSEQTSPVPALSEARLAANIANAQLSTGPRTPEGKAKSSINSVRTALTGRTVLLPSDDVAAYRQHVQDFVDEFQPVGPRESELVQALSDHAWRLNRVASLEMAIFAAGHEQFAEQFADRGAMQGSFTQMHTFLHYERQIRNLQIQEMRLRRNREKDTTELHRLQQDRRQKEQDSKLVRTSKSLEPSQSSTETAQQRPKAPWQPCDIGFDFSTSDIDAELGAVQHFVKAPPTGSELAARDSRPQIAA